MMLEHAVAGRLKIIVRPNSSRTELIEWDENRQAYRMNVKAPPEKGKANIEIVKFLSKKLKKQVKIVSGLTSREKIVRIS